MTQPRIGITTSYAENKQTVNVHYARAVEAAGGLPLIMPLVECEETAAALAGLVDGLIITGGPGITRGIIGTLPDDLNPVDPGRDTSDDLLYRAMVQRGKPILGICYGMQFINAQYGGKIYGDVMQQQPGTVAHSDDRGGKDHTITIEADSTLGRIFDTASLTVNTYHIQAVAEVGTGLKTTAHSTDGVIEGIESEDGHLFGVQFHPERMGEAGLPIFRHFVMQCTAKLTT